MAMELEVYKSKAVELLKQFDEMCANPQNYTSDNYYHDTDNLAREFRHLVYSSDPSLPLNNELNKENTFVVHFPSMEDSFKSESLNVRNLISFFIKYIDEYGSKD